MTGKLSDLDIYVQTLREEIHVKLVMTVIFEKVYLIVGHGHFAVVVFQTGFINNQAAIGHHVFAEVRFIAFHGTGNAEVRPDLTAFFHVLLGEISSIGGFTGTGDSKVQGERNRL